MTAPATAAGQRPGAVPGRLDGRMRPSTVLRLALGGGRSDRLRIVLTVVGTALAALLLMAAVNVADIRSLGAPGPPPGQLAIELDSGWQFVGTTDEVDEFLATRAAEMGVPVDQVAYDRWSPESDGWWFNSYGRYRNTLLDEPGLHIGVMITTIALLVPLLLFVGQCARIGAPQRDRRLAALRVAGATPRQTALIAVVESAAAAALGALAGVGGFHALRALDPQRPDAEGLLRWPTDITIPAWHTALVVVTLPALVALGTRFALRKVSTSPFGVLRRRSTQAPAALPAVLFVVGMLAIVGFEAVLRRTTGSWALAVPIVGVLLVVIGLSTGAATITQRLGGWLARSTSSPAALLAGRRAVDAPYQASRPATAVLLAVLLAAAVAQTRRNFLAATDPGDTLYASTFDLLAVVLVVGVGLSLAGLTVVAAEAVVTRRRTLAALVASGTPRATLRRSIVIETLIAIVPLAPAAAAAGTVASRSVFGTSVEYDGRLVPVAVPWGALGVIVVGTLAAAVAVTAVGLLLLPASTAPTELRTAA